MCFAPVIVLRERAGGQPLDGREKAKGINAGQSLLTIKLLRGLIRFLPGISGRRRAGGGRPRVRPTQIFALRSDTTIVFGLVWESLPAGGASLRCRPSSVTE